MYYCPSSYINLLAIVSQALSIDGQTQDPFQDIPLRPRSCPPATGIKLMHVIIYHPYMHMHIMLH